MFGIYGHVNTMLYFSIFMILDVYNLFHFQMSLYFCCLFHVVNSCLVWKKYIYVRFDLESIQRRLQIHFVVYKVVKNANCRDPCKKFCYVSMWIINCNDDKKK